MKGVQWVPRGGRGEGEGEGGLREVMESANGRQEQAACEDETRDGEAR